MGSGAKFNRLIKIGLFRSFLSGQVERTAYDIVVPIQAAGRDFSRNRSSDLSMTRVDFSKLKFLVAEDNRFMREICRTILFSYGVRDVFEATDGAEALATFKERVPDIILLDLHMPILDGFDVLRMVRDRATSPNAYVAVIVLSAYSERSRVIQARDFGATEYLVKPVSARGIYDRVANVVFNPRPFVENKTYFGPDRRRFVMPSLNREDRRVADIPENTVRLIDV